MTRVLFGLTAAVVLMLSAVSAQDVQPTCRNCPGTYIDNAELQGYLTITFRI